MVGLRLSKNNKQVSEVSKLSADRLDSGCSILNNHTLYFAWNYLGGTE